MRYRARSVLLSLSSWQSTKESIEPRHRTRQSFDPGTMSDSATTLPLSNARRMLRFPPNGSGTK